MSCFYQITTDKSISDFDSNEADTDKKNPYHGILTLTIQSKGADNNSTTTTRGPGRPPINDVPLDEIPETEDPVSQLLFFFHFEEVKIEANYLNHFFLQTFSVVNKIAFNVSEHSLQYKPFAYILAKI